MSNKQRCVDIIFGSGDEITYEDVYDVIDTASLISIAVSRNEIVSYPIQTLARIRIYEKTNIVK